jgi:hypothetical protein
MGQRRQIDSFASHIFKNQLPVFCIDLSKLVKKIKKILMRSENLLYTVKNTLKVREN